MAKGQTAGVNAITVWMIIFAALWLTSTVFLVILYTGQEALNNEVARLQAANRRLISPAQENSVDLARQAQEGGTTTVVGLLDDARKKTADLATGNETDDVETVRRKRNQLVERITTDRIIPQPGDFKDISLFAGMEQLYEILRTEHELRRTAETRVSDLESEVTRLAESSAEQKDHFDAQLKELDEKLAQIEGDRAANLAERDETTTRLRAEFERERAQANVDLVAERQANADLRRDLADLRTRFQAQQQRFGQAAGGPDRLTTARRADGMILTAVPGDDVVYIDLGRDDRLMLGLQFSVYSSQAGIPANGRGKAQIEVVSIAPASAECRILGIEPAEVIVEGDLIANPVYDRDRPVTFMTVGGFDLDRDGQYDPEGRATIEAMITAWGGQITNELTALTDFLIVGGPPPQPREGRDLAAAQRARNEELQLAYDTYVTVIESARSLSVPTMSQGLFLDFLGYGGRVARR